jgi:hypothetical protein
MAGSSFKTGAEAFPDLGSGHRNAGLEIRENRRRHRHLLLRPALTLAAWHQRKHEWPAGVVPKGTDLSIHSATDLDWVAQELNDRPRKRLEFRKPIELIEGLLLQ